VRLIVGLCSLLFALWAVAKPAEEAAAAAGHVDLMQLYRESRLEDPRVLASYAQAESSKERQRESLGRMLPQISADAGLNRIVRDSKFSREAYNTERYVLSLTQHLYNKEVWENYQKFKSLAVQKGFESESTQAEATIELSKRYFLALASDDDLELIMAERRATQKNLDRINALYKRQMAMVTDVLELQARVDQLAAMEVEARNQVRLAREALSEIVGRPVNERLSRIREDVPLAVPGESLTRWVEQAMVENPALKAKQSALEASDAALREGKGGHYPSLSLNLSAQRSNTGYENSTSVRADSYVATLGIRVPIYSGGSTSARVRSLHNDRLVAEQDLEMIKRQVVKETTNSYLTAQSSVEKIRALRRAMESAEQSSIAAQKGFQFGVVNAVNVLESVQKEYEVRRDLLKAQYDFITNLLVLNRWAGELSEQSVENVNTWLAETDKARALEQKQQP